MTLGLTLILAVLGGTAQAATTRVTICHIPPGNPSNAHSITVSESAVPAHMAHGDSMGSCPDDQTASSSSSGGGTSGSGIQPVDYTICSPSGGGRKLTVSVAGGVATSTTSCD